ncbi:threonylcarbamoyl-AMP synthase [mine drainage metagenome]|uniref:Threonylcarbamoyl-AMP synthase n=1 Tax=mine drainage metagenome TaxID=410659 RepID=A0A1J5RMC0_9ZZZZ
MRISLDEAAARLKNGEVVAIPTETVYGLAADATNDAALQQIFTIKQRPADHPLIVHIGDISQVIDWAAEFPELAVNLAKAFWPGALTLVLPAKDHVSRVVRGGESTIALRVPDHPVTQALLKASGLSVAAPSANLFTQLSPTSADHVEAGLGNAIPVLDGGACRVGIESTIVSVSEDEAGAHWQLLRPGMISEVEITRVAGQPQYASEIHVEDTLASIPVPKVPGQHALHYSPRTPLRLFKDKAALLSECKVLMQEKITCAALFVGAAEALQYTSSELPRMELPDLPAQVAEQLYGALHALDDLKVDCLLVEMPPNTPEWTAVRDRLSRAGHH